MQYVLLQKHASHPVEIGSIEHRPVARTVIVRCPDGHRLIC